MQKAYLNYLNESLGLEDFILPIPDTKAKSHGASFSSPLAFYIQSAQKELSSAALDLLGKMTQAMGRSLAQVPVVMLSAGNPFTDGSAPIKVLFSSDADSTQVGKWKDGVMTTFSPELLVQRPDLKKPTWTHLQAVMAELAK